MSLQKIAIYIVIALKEQTAGCHFNRDIANGSKLFKPGPELPVEIIAELKPIYLSLSEDALLTRCLDGKTQNQNEALNGTIWERVPKEVFVGADT